jgi:two-component system chemotaxis response regulator CheY
LRSDKTVLVVDDDFHIRRTIELKLKAAGYAVLTACEGRQGVETIRARHPDAVITDLTMPDVDGKALCEMTDGLKTEKPFLTVVLTARIIPCEHDWIKLMHDTIFMEKPFSPRRLLDVVDRYLGEIHEE